MLLEEENSILGKLIALMNGVQEFEYDANFESIIRDSIRSIKNGVHWEQTIQQLVESKAQYLKNCLTCQMPCGKTTDYSINDQIEAVRNKKIMQWRNFLNQYNDSIPFQDIIYSIASLGW